jgi:hypothetical protein
VVENTAEIYLEESVKEGGALAFIDPLNKLINGRMLIRELLL